MASPMVDYFYRWMSSLTRGVTLKKSLSNAPTLFFCYILKVQINDLSFFSFVSDIKSDSFIWPLIHLSFTDFPKSYILIWFI